MKRLVSTVAAAIALGLVAAACSSGGRGSAASSSTPEDDAAVVNGAGIKRSDFAAGVQEVSDAAAPLLNQFLPSGVGGSIVNPKYGVWDPATHQVLPPGFRPEPQHAASSSSTTGG